MLRSSCRTSRTAGPVLGRCLVRPRARARYLATETTPASTEGTPPPPPSTPKKGFGLFTRFLVYSSVLTLGFYGGSTAVALGSEEYRNWFLERMPFAEQIMQYTDKQGFDRAVIKTKATSEKVVKSAARLERKIEEALPKSASAAITSTKEAVKSSSRKVSEVAHNASDKTQKAASEAFQAAKAGTKERVARVKASTLNPSDEVPRPSEFSEGVEELVRKAEQALEKTVAGLVPIASGTPSAEASGADPKPVPEAIPQPQPEPEVSDPTVWTAPLPLGFEPPPGYKLPKPKPKPGSSSNSKAPTTPGPPKLPLISPEVATLATSEPVIGQLAATIDSLTALVQSSPTIAGKVKAVLEGARKELTSLAERIEAARLTEREKMEKTITEQTASFNQKMTELRMSVREKFDSQEETWKQAFDEERQKVITSYREKLEAELETQSAIINERLKSEIIAQGIEMERRWLRDVKVRVEQEREGRLSKLEDLASSLQKLERLTLDNAAYLDDNLQLHALWASLRALGKTLESPARKPFRDDLRTLRSAVSVRNDPVINSALDSLESSTTPDIGVEPLADLTSWFTTAVAPQLFSIALVPDKNAGVLSHLAATALSSLQFRRRGLVEGNDVLSVVARAEYYLNEKNLDAAARELNQLQGPAKVLLSDWLDAVRRRLEVEQALEVIRAQATFSSLMVL